MSRRRVAVLGGGMGGLAAAWALSRTEAARQRFEVTVYTLGFRLGGKGASARNPDAHDRIEEHGLHLLMGCYDNFFSIMRDCYATAAHPEGSPLQRWDDAFTPRNETVLTDLHLGRVHRWHQRFPELPNRPGDGEPLPGPARGLAVLVQWALRAVRGASLDDWQPGRAASGSPAGIARRLRDAERLLPTAGATASVSSLVLALSIARALAHAALAVPQAQVRRAALSVDFMLTTAIGVLRDDLLRAPGGRWHAATHADWLDNLQAIDHLDYREWLAGHGAHEQTLHGPIVRGYLEALFSERVAAGVALHGMFRMNLTYRGALFYEMAAGMGETVFTPLYRTLRQRGVRFRFFHRARALCLSPDQRRVQAIRFARQAEPIGEYEPLRAVPVAGGGSLWCWPDRPHWDQLRDGARLREAGVDFESGDPVLGERDVIERDVDEVVLAVPVGALGEMTRELTAASPAWASMLDHAETTATQSLQLWLDAALPRHASPQPGQTLTGFATPLATWADMTHLGRVEGHPPGTVGAQLYACGAVDEPIDPVALDRQATAFVADRLPALLGDEGTPRLADRRFVVNDRPWERYVRCPPGSPAYRLPADGSGIDNLRLAGDWVRTPFNVGCIEAAAMAGLRAAKSLGVALAVHGDPDRVPPAPARPEIAPLPVITPARPVIRTSPTFYGEARVLVDAPLAEIAHIIDPCRWSTYLRQVVVSRLHPPGLVDGRGLLHEEVDVLTPNRPRGGPLRLRCLLDVHVERSPRAKTVRYHLHRSLDDSLSINEGELSIEDRGPTASVVRVTKRLRVSGNPLLRAMLTFNPRGLSHLMQQWLLEAAHHPGRSLPTPTIAEEPILSSWIARE